MSLAVQSRKKTSLKTNAPNFKTPKRLINGTTDNTSLTKNKSCLSLNSSKSAKNLDDLNKMKKFDEEKKPDIKQEPKDAEEKSSNAKPESAKCDDFVELELSQEEIKQREKYFEEKLKDLGNKLRKIRQMGVCSGQALSDLKENEMSESLSLYLKEYLCHVGNLERDCDDKLESLNEWYLREKEDIEETYRTEKKKAEQEFHEKRKELKENLINEHEEIRKQIEIDRNTLDINMDTTEIKPPPTRNLRRRTNHNNENDTSCHDLSSSHVGLHVSSSVSSSSGLLQSNTANVTSTGNHSSNNTLGSCQTNFYSVQPNFYSSSCYSQFVNDRKRKFTPNTMFQLSEDDVNDDFKYLSKNLRLAHCHSPCKN
ncbi:sin3 histone deacetylase corepressor complex component SDS3 [Brachionus plicatilis]|uniref:Sin3 histone deacetylase corepressor complex component SDS3 n=1 Tax=Brachionus plicatilis TaxID=10195 RepID=A0A3M7QDT0_BRAPC|nr:sin3 histone deacetylase corepressor complex component SDS3 [Brachionus plicatilis]